MAVLALGCRTPVPAPPAPLPPTTREPPDQPMPTASSVGMWMQILEQGWRRTTLSIFADGRVVSQRGEGQDVRKKYVRRAALERIRAAAEEVGLWTLKRDCCDCRNDPVLAVSDGRNVIFQFFEPGRVLEIEHRQGCAVVDRLPWLADRIYELLGPDRWHGPDGAPVEVVVRAAGPLPDDPGAVLRVAWINPSEHVVLACGQDLSDGRQHVIGQGWPPGPWTGRFPIAAGSGQVQCYVGDHAGPVTRWQIFSDAYRCPRGGTLEARVRLDRGADGQLSFLAAYSSAECSAPKPTSERRPVSRTDLDPPMCCFEKIRDPWED